MKAFAMLLVLLMLGCSSSSKFETTDERYKFTCVKIEEQKGSSAMYVTERCENKEVYCYNTVLVSFVFPALTSNCFEKLQ